MTTLKIWYLKRKLKKLIIQYRSLLAAYSCGESLALMVNPNLCVIKFKILKHGKELNELDPNSPDFNKLFN